MKTKIWLLCGIPGSGKSTWATAQNNGLIVSRDEIRFSLLEPGDTYFAKEKKVWKQFIKTIKDNIGKFDNIYVDATHLNWVSRRKIITALNYTNIGVIVFTTPFEECLKRNAKREGLRKVPIGRMFEAYNKITHPKNDSFNYIEIKEV